MFILSYQQIRPSELGWSTFVDIIRMEHLIAIK